MLSMDVPHTYKFGMLTFIEGAKLRRPCGRILNSGTATKDKGESFEGGLALLKWREGEWSLKNRAVMHCSTSGASSSRNLG